MHLQHVLTPLALLPLTLSAPLETYQTPLDPSSDLDSTYRVPTRYESTILGRRLLALSTTGVISSIFPPPPSNKGGDDGPFTPPPESVASLSIALPDYLADCDSPSHGNPTLLFLDPSTSSRNSRSPLPPPQHANNISLSLSWWDAYPLLTGRKPWAPANLPRLSMVGFLDEVAVPEAEAAGLVACYLEKHPDARLWLPGDEGAAHAGRWLRLVVQEVYWMGGFGDRNWIGWFDLDEWRAVGKAEWDAVRLPGERD